MEDLDRSDEDPAIPIAFDVFAKFCGEIDGEPRRHRNYEIEKAKSSAQAPSSLHHF
jgi:hypothetical protein